MAQKKRACQPLSKTLPKAATGILGLDEITVGGLPRGRPTLVSGGAGSGKTLFGLEFLVRGATQYGEPGVFISFEESIPDLIKNVASLGFDLDRLVADKKLFVDHVSITQSDSGETGEYDLEGLFIRIADAVQRVGAQRVVLDTIEALFVDLPNPGILRAEIRRLFNWLKQKGLTTVITAERDKPDRLTQQGIEAFVSDCVILLDHRIREEMWLAKIPYIRRINDLRARLHSTNSVKIRSCLCAFDICSAGVSPSFAPEKNSSWRTSPFGNNCWLCTQSDLALECVPSTGCSGSFCDKFALAGRNR